MKLSLVMIVKNEEGPLEECLRRAVPLVDEIIVADTGSTDCTKAVALRMGARVYDYEWTDDFSSARNFALEHSTGDWNLVLDADEYLRPGSREELECFIENMVRLHKEQWVGAITRYDTYPDEEGGTSVSVTSIPRLLPAGMRYTGIIHEQPDTGFPCYKIPLKADHDGYIRRDKGERNLPYLREATRRYPEDLYYKFQMAATLRNMGQYQESLEWFRVFYAGCCGCRGRAGKKPHKGIADHVRERCPPDAAYHIEGILLYLYTLMDAGDRRCLEEAKTVIEQEKENMGIRSDFCFVCGLFYMKLVLSDVKQYVRFLPEIEASYLRCLEIGEHPGQDGVVGTGSFKAAYNLGLWYEVSGQTEKALQYYRQAEEAGYGRASERLKLLRK